MAKNTGNGHRAGVVSGRTQVYNPTTEKYIKRDAKTGKFMSSKDTPFKNIRNEEAIKNAKAKKVDNNKNKVQKKNK